MTHSPIWHPFTQHALLPDSVFIDRAEGAYLYAKDGRRIIDAISSWWVNIHGHNHPKIVAAVQEQAAKLDQIIFAGFTHEPAERLAEKLVGLTPPNLTRVFYSDSGSTAVEVALKMALGYWAHKDKPRVGVVALDHAYHGDTFGAMSVGSRGVFAVAPEESGAAKPTGRQYALWLALPACASALLLAVTNHMSQNVAAVPFLWILPLSLYLLSFIVCFAGHGCYRRSPFLQLLAVALGSMAYAITEGNLPIVIVVLLFSLGLFLCAMACHGELALLKPQPRYLTHFYLTISAGGALGGLAVGLVSPHVFNGYYEMPLGLVGCAGLILAVLKTDPALPWFRRWTQPAPIASLALTVILAVYVAIAWHQAMSGVRLQVRNFYGELTVKDSDPPTSINATRTLMHGTITHGNQFLNLAKRDLPTTYYGPNTGVGLAVRDRGKGRAVRVGVIGLGTGTLAAYARQGDYYRYYEINPLVVRVARTEFTFLADCHGKLDIAMGDARLSLEREQPENFDVLAVDAFSGDAIPVHLLTSEAMDLYFRHLQPDGILAVHISNRHLDLLPVLAGEARSSGRRARVVDTEDDDDTGVFAATWVLVAAPPGDFDNEIRANSNPVSRSQRVRLWTDDYSNLFQILK